MKRAAAKGIIDFSKAKFYDPGWIKKLSWMLEEVEAEEYKELLKLKFIQHSGALNYQSGKDNFELHWKKLHDITIDWASLAIPWQDAGTKKSESREEMAEKWRRTFGDPKDPEVFKQIQEAIKASSAKPQPKETVKSTNRKKSPRGKA